MDLESFLKNLLMVMQFWAVVAHDLLHKNLSQLFHWIRHSSPKSPYHGIFEDILWNTSDLSPQTELCSAAVTSMLLTMKANNCCGQKARKQDLCFLLMLWIGFFNLVHHAIVDISAPGLSLELLPCRHCGWPHNWTGGMSLRWEKWTP